MADSSAAHHDVSGADDTLPLPRELLQELARALRSIRYGAVELVIHDGQVVQLERREKVRLDAGGRGQHRSS